jgi:hypothetical protein
MDTGEKEKKKFNIPKKKIWGWIKETVKDPLTLLLFAVLWLILSSPAIFGVIAYWASKEERWLVLSGSWIAFTAPPLPLPVTPLSIAGAIALRAVIRKAGIKNKARKEEAANKRRAEKMRALAKKEADNELVANSKLVEIVDIYNTGSVSISDEGLITGVEYVPGMENLQKRLDSKPPGEEINSISPSKETVEYRSLIENQQEEGIEPTKETLDDRSLIENQEEEVIEPTKETLDDRSLIESQQEEGIEVPPASSVIEKSLPEEVSQETISKGRFIQYSKNTCDFSRGMNCQR